jgi:hypothetical protein
MRCSPPAEIDQLTEPEIRSITQHPARREQVARLDDDGDLADRLVTPASLSPSDRACGYQGFERGDISA